MSTMDGVSGQIPYRNLRKEIELQAATLDVDESLPRSTQDSSDLRSGSVSSTSKSQYSLVSLALSCSVAAGVQFGWALQLSLLTPYIQNLGIEHAFSSFIWLCGPITGLVVQPCVGIMSDKCTSRFGRRRPFILFGSLMISVAVMIIGFSADIGFILGDTKEHCSTYKGTRTRAALIFVIGFWMLDLANNTVQGPARALLADLCGPDQRNLVNAVFCSWMAVGNILGFSAGASGSWNRWFPFLRSRACCEACGNLKAAFLVAVVFLTVCTLVTLYFANEVPFVMPDGHRLSDVDPLLDVSEENGHVLENYKINTPTGNYKRFVPETVDSQELDATPSFDNSDERMSEGIGSILVNILTSIRHLPVGMHSVLVVMAFTWFSWFPFFLFDTDWMGREVFHGNPNGDSGEVKLYEQGVREGAFGLLLNSVVLGISSIFIEPMCRKMGSRIVWALSNFIVFACMAGTAIIGLVSSGEHSLEHAVGENTHTKVAALLVFALLGFPLAITYSVPFSVTAELTADSGGGQGLAIGVLNLAIVIPQMFVSLGAGPWDALFGGGNTPAFGVASACALVACVYALLKLPHLSSNSYAPSAFHFG